MGDNSFPMNGGVHAYSYTNNCLIQREGTDCTKRMISEAITQTLELKDTALVRIADLGCSVGPNTISVVEHLIAAVEDKYRRRRSSSSSENMEFQVFFNDHSSNDFNTLFSSIAASPPGTMRNYYAAGMAGSFHGRVFPRTSIAVAHSSYALHWLSVSPRVSSGGRMVRAGCPEGDDDVVVSKAYLERFERDVGGFMRARAEEIVEGGLMFLLTLGIVDGHFLYATAFDLFLSTLTDLAAEGVIDKAEIEGFNYPIYIPSEEEMRKVIEENGSFSIERVELTKPGSRMSARDIILHLRATTEGIFTQKFGESVMEMMFGRSLARVEEEASVSRMVEADLYNVTHLFYVLKRK